MSAAGLAVAAVRQPDGAVAELGAGDQVELVGLGNVVEQPGTLARNVGVQVQAELLAEDGSLVGFANTLFDDDPTWGALLDNLHVADGHKRRGIASRLLALTAEAVMERPERTGLYLWVLEQNVDAQAFYEARGGRCVGRGLASPPGGIASRVTGSSAKLRYAWPEPTVLLGRP
jgi:ribosomal protein S18 acetylase RimI-like enzyme